MVFIYLLQDSEKVEENGKKKKKKIDVIDVSIGVANRKVWQEKQFICNNQPRFE